MKTKRAKERTFRFLKPSSIRANRVRMGLALIAGRDFSEVLSAELFKMK